MFNNTIKIVLTAAALAVFSPLMPAAVAPVATASAQDAAAGENLFRRCMACHMVGEGAQNRVGPQLNGVIGRQIGTVEGYGYSDGLVARGADGTVWDAELMAAYFADPNEFIGERSRMPVQRLRDDQIPDLIAYLETYALDGTPAE